ncbi:MAG: 5-(carboxyamino)imidazole ribonucleotide mutase [Thermodesulfobacteriota bacterium]|nr:5-(carboxyamino)imidazole ribonucleotide mutase [Thermodesulfobacteriota bacterium]
MQKPLVGIVMGSDSDLPVMEEAKKLLEHLEIAYELTISSAHRAPDRTIKYAKSAIEKGLEVIIVGAGSAAHLAGIIAAHTSIPVIGVPIDSSCLKGIDALLSTVQMPGGIPVATMAIGKAGAKNAAVFAAQILGVRYHKIREKLIIFKKELALQVEEKARRLENLS